MNTAHLSDKDLVTRILSGHPDLFGPLVERHIRAAHAIAYARLGNTTDAEDAVQEAFLRAYEKLGTLRDPARFAAWLLTIARHEAARIATKRHTPVPSPSTDTDSEHYAVEETRTHPDPAQHELNAILRDHVMRLPEAAREVLLLHYFAGHSARDIAELLDLRRAAVLKRLQRAREQLAEAMLRDLETARPTEASVAKQALRIAALASAAALPSATVGTVAAVTAAGIGLSMKAILASLALVAAGGVIGITVWRAGESLPIRAESDIDASPAVSPARSFSAETETTPRVESAAETVATAQRSAPVAEISQPKRASVVAAKKKSAPTDLTGIWAVEVTGPSGSIDDYTVLALAPLTLEDLGATIEVTPGPDGGYISGLGDVLGERIAFDLKTSKETRPELAIKIHVEGEFKRSALELSLKGISEHARYERREGGAVKILGTIKAPVEMKWRRIAIDTLDQQQFTNMRKEELIKLARTIFKYAAEQGGRPPARLEELVPKYLPNLRPYSQETGAHLTYTFPLFLPSVNIDTDYNTGVENGRARQARMIEVEAEYRAVYGDRFLSVAPMIEAVYDQFDLTLVVTINGEVGPPDSVGCAIIPIADALTDEQKSEKIVECQNNLKQLGLSYKMFTQEDREKRGPAGWLMTYPEYVPDRCILICPGSGKRVAAYELLFPAVNNAELEATYDALFGKEPSSESSGARGRHIPIIVETDECSGSGGRNVLFLDGHVEHRKGRLESYPDLAPFLNLR